MPTSEPESKSVVEYQPIVSLPDDPLGLMYPPTDCWAVFFEAALRLRDLARARRAARQEKAAPGGDGVLCKGK